jgi:hypothetical protein
LWRPFLANFALVLFGASVAAPLLAWVRADLPPRLALGFEYGWALLWAVGAATCVRAARLPRGLAFCFIGLSVALSLWLVGRGP